LRTLRVLFITVELEPYIVEIIELGQALTVVCQIDVVLEIESTIRGTLPLTRETFKHAFFWRKSRVIFAKAPVKYAACATLLLELFKKSFLSLRYAE
jgi:hypothetical protein